MFTILMSSSLILPLVICQPAQPSADMLDQQYTIYIEKDGPYLALILDFSPYFEEIDE